MGMLAYIAMSSVIGFFIIVILIGFLLHLGLSKTKIYSRKVRAKGMLSKFLYICVFLIVLYVLLLAIFGVINLIDF